LYSFINKMVFSLEHDIKVTKSHQNLLPTQSVIVVHTVVIYVTSFCVNWAFLISRGTRLKHEGFKASRAIRKAQFTQKRVPYKVLLFETTSLKLPNLLKMVSHLLLLVLTNFSRPVRNVTSNVLSRATVRYLLILL
jgi:hypothetical protein